MSVWWKTTQARSHMHNFLEQSSFRPRRQGICHDEVHGPKDGFTLLEVLIAMTIVAMTVTVYFQLISAGMKLEFQADRKVALVVQAQQVFARLQTQDVRDDSFQWTGEQDECTWNLHFQPQDIQDLVLEDNEINMKQPTELFSFLFTYTCPKDKRVVMQRTIVVGKDHFSDQFIQDHEAMNPL